MLCERPLGALGSAFDVARSLADQPGLLLCFTDSGRRPWVTCRPERTVFELDPEPELDLAAGGDATPRWFGLLPYEARRSLERGGARDQRSEPGCSAACWRRYHAWVDVSRGRVVGDDEASVRELAALVTRDRAPRGVVELELSDPVEPAHVHARRIEQALALISQGEIYEVNLARRFGFRVSGRPWDVLEALAGAELPPYALALEWPEVSVIATSPELFLASVGRRVWTSPIKGTRPRSADQAQDRNLARELDEDPKEIAELTMIIDVERNDLGRLAIPGSVHLARPPSVEAHGTVHHRVATIEAELAGGVSRAKLLEAMLPSGSVTGAPKVRAMEIIAELEAHRRGLYTGAFGVIRHDGGVELGMAIRTLVVQGGAGHYFSGGGIVADSVPEREVQETLWKASQYLALAGHEPR